MCLFNIYCSSVTVTLPSPYFLWELLMTEVAVMDTDNDLDIHQQHTPSCIVFLYYFCPTFTWTSVKVVLYPVSVRLCLTAWPPELQKGMDVKTGQQWRGGVELNSCFLFYIFYFYLVPNNISGFHRKCFALYSFVLILHSSVLFSGRSTGSFWLTLVWSTTETQTRKRFMFIYLISFFFFYFQSSFQHARVWLHERSVKNVSCSPVGFECCDVLFSRKTIWTERLTWNPVWRCQSLMWRKTTASRYRSAVGVITPWILLSVWFTYVSLCYTLTPRHLCCPDEGGGLHVVCHDGRNQTELDWSSEEVHSAE